MTHSQQAAVLDNFCPLVMSSCASKQLVGSGNLAAVCQLHIYRAHTKQQRLIRNMPSIMLLMYMPFNITCNQSLTDVCSSLLILGFKAAAAVAAAAGDPTAWQHRHELQRGNS
jgi:hypothetical protein